MIVAKKRLITCRTHCMDLKNTTVAVQSLDFSGTIIDVSPGWLGLTGYERNEVIGRHFFEFLDKETLLKVDECFPHLKDYGYVDNVALKIRCKKGGTLLVSLTGTSKYNEKGVFERTYCEIVPKLTR